MTTDPASVPPIAPSTVDAASTAADDLVTESPDIETLANEEPMRVADDVDPGDPGSEPS